MILVSPILAGDVRIEDCYSKEVLKLLEGVRVYWITERVYSLKESHLKQMGNPSSAVLEYIPEGNGWKHIPEGVVYVFSYNLFDDQLMNESILIHELVHLKQRKDNRLEDRGIGGLYWEGRPVQEYPINSEGYWTQPWEVEAYQAQAEYLNQDNPESEYKRLEEMWISLYL